jgi:hypothetical protein
MCVYTIVWHLQTTKDHVQLHSGPEFSRKTSRSATCTCHASTTDNSERGLTRICKLQDTAKAHTDHTCGLRRFGRQAGSTPGPQSRLTAHNSEPRKDAAAHNALHARAQRDNRMPRGGRCSNAIDSHHSAPRRRPLRAAHRHAAPPHPSGLPCGAVDRPGLKGTRSSSSA